MSCTALKDNNQLHQTPEGLKTVQQKYSLSRNSDMLLMLNNQTQWPVTAMCQRTRVLFIHFDNLSIIVETGNGIQTRVNSMLPPPAYFSIGNLSQSDHWVNAEAIIVQTITTWKHQFKHLVQFYMGQQLFHYLSKNHQVFN